MHLCYAFYASIKDGGLKFQGPEWKTPNKDIGSNIFPETTC